MRRLKDGKRRRQTRSSAGPLLTSLSYQYGRTRVIRENTYSPWLEHDRLAENGARRLRATQPSMVLPAISASAGLAPQPREECHARLTSITTPAAARENSLIRGQGCGNSRTCAALAPGDTLQSRRRVLVALVPEQGDQPWKSG